VSRLLGGGLGSEPASDARKDSVAELTSEINSFIDELTTDE